MYTCNRDEKCSDYDDDCKDGLVCWYDDGSGDVPGCSGTPEITWEYCIDPSTMPLQNATQSDAQIIAADSIEANSDARPSLLERGGLNRCEGDWSDDRLNSYYHLLCVYKTIHI